MIASVFRSCFGTCFRKFGGVGGYESIENDDGHYDGHYDAHGHYDGHYAARLEESQRQAKGDYMYEPEFKHSEYTSVLLNFDRAPKPDYRSRSTGEIFRGYEFDNKVTLTSEKRAFSVSFGYLNDRTLYRTMSGSVDNVWTSAADLRSEVSDAFYSCKGSLFDLAYYSDSEDGSPEAKCGGCEQCGVTRHHSYTELERAEWSSTPIVPKSSKWIQLS